MKQQFRFISILVISIILLPVIFFSAYEINRIGKNEKELENIYNKQLDAILFSINLYSDDIINSWTSKIKGSVNQNDLCDSGSFKKFLAENHQLRAIFISKDSTNQDFCLFTIDSTFHESKQELSNILSDSSKKIDRLRTYFRGGYQRNEPLGLSLESGNLFVAFVCKMQNKAQLCILEIDPYFFIRDLLAQKIQSVAENRFDIGIHDLKTSRLVYSFGTIKDVSEFQHRKNIWLFPQYEMGIRLKDKSISSISKEQSRTTLFFILLADFVFIIAAFIVFRNIRKELKLTQIKTEFVSNVSHEIRTPLALISMYAETLEMGRVKNEEKKKEYYQVIHDETKRLTGIVNRILNFSKMESGKRTYTLLETDLNEVVAKVLQNYRFHFQIKGFEHKLDLMSGLPLVMADAESIADVLINLLDNAIKYSTDTKLIEVRTGTKNNFVFAEVSDKGVGIAKEDQRLVFDKFYRVSKGNIAHIAKGTGLGLSIVKTIMEANNGKVELESKKGEGSTFRILLPSKI